MFNICDRPPQIKRNDAPALDLEKEEEVHLNTGDVRRRLAAINVPFLNTFYGIPTNTGSLLHYTTMHIPQFLIYIYNLYTPLPLYYDSCPIPLTSGTSYLHWVCADLFPGRYELIPDLFRRYTV